MKKILLLLFIISSFSATAQRFPSIDSLQTYLLRYVRNSATESFTNIRLQNVTYGITEFLEYIDSNSGVDSIWIVDGGSVDTLRYRRWAVTYTAGLISGGGGGGSGTVTSFSAGNLSPLFTTSVATATTTPALTFSLSTQTANRVFAGPTTGGAASPTFRALVAADIPALTYVPYTLINGGANIGTGSDVFKDTSSNKLNFRRINGASGVTVTQNTNDITISGNADSTASRLRKGTYAQRIAFTAVDGDVWIQTDRLRGMWFYDGDSWQFQGIPLRYLFYNQFSGNSTGSTTEPGYNSLFSTVGSGSNTQKVNTIVNSDWWYTFVSTGTGYVSATIATTTNGGIDDDYHIDSVILYFETTVLVDTIGNATNDYGISIGFDNSASDYTTGDRIIFRYNYAVNGGEWETRTVAAGSGTWTTKDTNVPLVAGTPIKLAYEVDGYSRTIYFYINDVLVTTHTSSDNVPFPNATTVRTGVSPMMFNYNRLAGTTQRKMGVNYIFGYRIKSVK